MRHIVSALGLLAITAAAPAAAQPIVVADSGDSAWVLAASILVLLAALPGLALFHGRGRVGPAGLALFVSTASVSLLFAIVGYALSFGDGTLWLGNGAQMFLRNLADVQEGATIPESLYALFELTLAIFAVGILVASVAERARFGWLALFAPLWYLLVYAPLARWVPALGGNDYAGGITIQLSAGVAALVVALFLGRPHENSVANDSRLALAGLSFVWIGWFGVVGGAAFAAGSDASDAILNAQLAASAAAITGLALERLRTGSVAIFGATTAAISGLAAISAGADQVGPAGAMLLGITGAITAALAAAAVRMLKLGGAASAFVIHGAGGIGGALLFPVFVLPAFGGIGIDDTTSLAAMIVAQALAVGGATLWTIVMTAIAALTVSMVVPMRAPDRAG